MFTFLREIPEGAETQFAAKWTPQNYLMFHSRKVTALRKLFASLEKSGPKDHFALCFVLETPFSSGRGWLYLPRKDTLRRTIPLVNGSEQLF